MTAVKMGGSTKGARVARPKKKLTKRDLGTPRGRFAAHITALMNERGWSSTHVAGLLGIGEPTVRKWLRAESIPDTLYLEQLGDAFGLPDYRMILPPSK